MSSSLLDEIANCIKMFRTNVSSTLSIVLKNGLYFDDFHRIFNEMYMSGKKGIFINHRNTNSIDFMFPDKMNACYKDGFTTSFTSVEHIKTIDVTSSPIDGIGWSFDLYTLHPNIYYTPTESPSNATICEIWEFAYNNWLVYKFSKRSSGTNKYTMFGAPLQFQIELIPSRDALSKYTDLSLARTLVCKIEDICGRYIDDVCRHIDFTIDTVY